MAFQYVDFETARARPGLRMVVVGGVPSPWGEAAKGAFHVKGIDWLAVRLAHDDPALAAWAGGLSGPAAILDDEPPATDWAEILELAERLAPTPPLLPDDVSEREEAMALSHAILGEGSLCWNRRLQAIHAGLTGGAGGFHPKIATYLGGKYGYTPEAGAAAGEVTRAGLATLSDRLSAAPKGGYFFGDRLTAVDIHAAAAMALFKPLPEAICAMNPRTREVFETLDDKTAAALDPILLAHRDRLYRDVLETPLSL